MESALLLKIGADLASLRKSMTEAEGMVGGFKNSVMRLAGTMGVAFGTQAVLSYGLENVKLAGQVDGVRQAFSKLQNSQKILLEMQGATKGTVSEFDLMKSAVQASNFDIPLEQLASLFKFAHERAKATGQSVDYLVNSIVLGIGRKSPLILDNLGISLTQLNARLGDMSRAEATVADVAKAVGDIAKEALDKTGESAETAAEKIDKIGARWEDAKTRFANNAAPATNWFIDFVDRMIPGSYVKQIETKLWAAQNAIEHGKDASIQFQAATEAALKAGIDLNTYVNDNLLDSDKINKGAEAWREYYHAMKGQSFVASTFGASTFKTAGEVLAGNQPKGLTPSAGVKVLTAEEKAGIQKEQEAKAKQYADYVMEYQKSPAFKKAIAIKGGLTGSINVSTDIEGGLAKIKANREVLESEQELASFKAGAFAAEADMYAQRMQMYKQYSDIVAANLESAIVWQQSFADAFKRATISIIGDQAARATAAAITSSFESSGNPILGLALASAATGVIRGLFAGLANIGSGASSSYGGSTGAFAPSINSPTNRVVGVVRGQDLWLMQQNYITSSVYMRPPGG